MTDVVVCALKAPGPERLHVTPAALESFVSIAVTFTTWPATAFCDPLGLRVIAMGGLLLPQPENTTATARIIANVARTFILEFMNTPAFVS